MSSHIEEIINNSVKFEYQLYSKIILG